MSNALFNEDDFAEIASYLETQHKRRRSISLNVLFIRMLGMTIGQLSVSSTNSIVCEIHPYTTVLELWSEDEQGDILLASHSLLFNEHLLQRQSVRLFLPQDSRVPRKMISISYAGEKHIDVKYNLYNPINIGLSVVGQLVRICKNGFAGFDSVSRLVNINVDIFKIAVFRYKILSLLKNRVAYVMMIALIIIAFSSSIVINKINHNKSQIRPSEQNVAAQFAAYVNNLNVYKVEAKGEKVGILEIDKFPTVSDYIEAVDDFILSQPLDKQSSLKGDLQGLISLTKANIQNPQIPPNSLLLLAQAMLVKSYDTDGRFNNDLREIESMLSSSTSSPKPMILIGSIVTKTGKDRDDLSRAVNIFKDANERFPNDPEILIGWAVASHYLSLRDRGPCGKGEVKVNQVVQRFKNGLAARKSVAGYYYPSDYDDFAQFYRDTNHFELAIQEFTNGILALRPDDTLAHDTLNANLGVLFTDFGCYNRAEIYIKIVKRKDMLSEYIDLFMAQERYNDVISLLSSRSSALKDSYDKAFYFGKKGDAYYGLKMFSKAKAEYTEALSAIGEIKENETLNCGVTLVKKDQNVTEVCLSELEYTAKRYKIEKSITRRRSLERLFNEITAGIDLCNRDQKFNQAAALTHYALDNLDLANQELETVANQIDSNHYGRLTQRIIKDPVIKELYLLNGFKRLQRIQKSLKLYCSDRGMYKH